jgi:hypothetical protein
MAEPITSRIVVRVLKWAVQLYPPEKRAWGEAIVAEADSAAEVGASVSWMIGGLMVAFRAFVSRLFQRPAGKNETLLAGPAQIPPPIPWKLAVACVAISGALLFVPDLRQALSVTYSSWASEFIPRDETAMWQKIAREAESKGDAPAMAFAAMRLPSPEGERFDEAVRLAEQSVAKDASLTWTYYFLAQRRGDSRFHGSPHPELTQLLQEWDANNAVPYLAEADEIASAHSGDPQWRVWPNVSVDPPNPEDIARLRARDPRWLELMGRAFAAPTYDAYFDRRLNLDLKVMQRLGVMDPQLAVDAYFSGNRLPSLVHWREYAALRVAEGEEAERGGQWENAANEYWALAQFGQRVCLGGKLDVDVELVIARGLQESAFKHLQPVLLKLGHAQEARVVAYAAQLQHAENDETRARSRSVGQRLFMFSVASGLWVHFCAIVFEASVLLTAIVLLTFALKRAPRFVRLGLTYTPLLLVFGCTGLLCTYHPYAEYYRLYLADPSGQDQESIFNALIVTGIPQYAGNHWFLAALNPVSLWWAVIAALGAICIWLLSRTLRHRHV